MLPQPDKFYTDLGVRIKDERLRRKISQEKLGEYLDLKRTSVINLEKGRHRPSIYVLLTIADFFNMDYTELIPVPDKKGKATIKKKVRNLDGAITDQEFDKPARTVVQHFLSTLKK